MLFKLKTHASAHLYKLNVKIAMNTIEDLTGYWHLSSSFAGLNSNQEMSSGVFPWFKDELVPQINNEVLI